MMELDIRKLKRCVDVMLSETSLIPEGNRIYYFSTHLKLKPEIVSKYFTKHKFILEMSFSNLEESFQVFLKYGVQPMDMLRDLYAFRYKSSKIESRLKQAQDANKDKLMPWMVRCTEKVLQTSLQHSRESKALLKNHDSVVSYIAARLNYDLKTTEYIVSKHPCVTKIRVTKIKEVIDYLLNEAGFTPHHIALVPRILSHSLETTKERLDELKKYGCIPSSLVIVCRSRNEYQKFLNSWLEIRDKKRINTTSTSSGSSSDTD